MKHPNYTYQLFLKNDYSAIEIVNFLYREIPTTESKTKSQAIIEIMEGFVNQLKSEIHNLKIELEIETAKHLRSLTNQLAAAFAYLEKIIYSTIAHYKNRINYKVRKVQQIRQEIAVIGLYLEV